MLSNIITWLNSRFPPLPLWRMALVALAFVVSSLTSLDFLEKGTGPLLSLFPFLLLLVVWRPIPKGKRTSRWLFVLLWGGPMAFIAYHWVCRHLFSLL
jgi:hypothetical protein